MANLSLSVIINDSKKTFDITDVPCFTFTNNLVLKVFMVLAYVLVIGTSITGNTLLAFIYFKSKKHGDRNQLLHHEHGARRSSYHFSLHAKNDRSYSLQP